SSVRCSAPWGRCSGGLWAYSGMRLDVVTLAFWCGKSNPQRTGSVSFGSNGHVRFCSLAAFSTLLTVVFDALQLRAMLVWLRPNPANRMISRYLVINDDLLHNVFTHESA